MDIVDKVLADMREGRRVLVVSGDEPGIVKLVGLIAEKVEQGERAYRAARRQRIERRAGGLIIFATYGSAPASSRGLSLDSVYFDHSRMREALMPSLCAASVPRWAHF